MQKTIIQSTLVVPDLDPLINETLQTLGINEIPTVTLNLNPDGHSKEIEVPLFNVHEGNINFLMPNLQGRARTIKNKGILEPVILTKIEESTEEKEWKFGINNSAFDVFIDYAITRKFMLGKEIVHLILVDDPITAMLLNIDGIDAIAIPGYPYSSTDSIPNHIISTLTELCTICSVKKLSYIVPSDVVELNFKEDLDLYKKPKSVFTSIWNLYLALCMKLNIKYHFAYFNPELTGRRISIALSHAIVRDVKVIEEVKKEILNTFETPNNKWLVKYDLSNAKMFSIKEIFGIQDNAVSFYEKHCKTIMGDPFKFGKAIYQYDYDKEKAVYHRTAEAAQYICIAGTYYIKGKSVRANGSERPVLDRFPAEAFPMKFYYLNKEQIKSLQKQIPYFDSAEGIPSHTDYIQEWETVDSDTGFTLKFYNMYKKLMHKPKKGSIELSMKFIRHIFGENEITHKGKKYQSWQLGLDYVKLLYCNPKQKLPILCLVSHERQTGKTLFWDWMKEIFGDNATHITENDIASQFTSLFAGKLLAIMEETYIEKIQTFERLKELVTASHLKLEKKGKDAFEITNYMKVGISSNKISNFATIDNEETRFWVLQVPPIPKGHYDIHFTTKLFAEIPAFLAFIEEMPYHTECETRSWFADEIIKTDALERVKAKSRSQNEILIERTILTYMLEFNLTWCELTKTDIRDLSQEKDLNFKQINLILENKWNKEPSNRGLIYTFYEQLASSIAPEGFVRNEVTKKGMFYTFTLSDFERNINLNSLSLKQILEIIEHENNPLHPISQGWKESKAILVHPEIIKISEIINIQKIISESNSLKEFIENALMHMIPF